jgi:predicted glycosyltransferase
MYYSRIAISSGDSMAREGAMLGVPSIYCGPRKMKANQLLINLGFLSQTTDSGQILSLIKSKDTGLSDEEQTARRSHLFHHWDDPNQIVYEHLMDLAGHLLGAV